MANTLRFKRGLASGIPTAVAGEPLFTTDTFDLYIGNGTTNTRFQKYIASGTTSQLLRGDGSLLTMPIVLTSPSNGQVLKFNGTSWVNDSDSGITGSGSSGQVAYFTGATTQAGSNNLFWDNTNGRLGIGTNTPTFKAQIKGGNASTLKLDNDGSQYVQLMFERNTVSNSGADLLLDGTANTFSIRNLAANDFTITTGATAGAITERLRIKNTGNVLIGTTTDSGQRLQVVGTSYFSDNVGIGAIPSTSRLLNINKNITGAVTSYGSIILGNVQSDVTAGARVYYSEVGTAAASFTLPELTHYYAVQGTLGAGSAVTSQYGFRVHSGMTGATNDYAFHSDLAAGTGIWNLYMNGTANNYMAGSLGIGVNALTGYNLRINKAITGSAYPFSLAVSGAVQSDVTGIGTYIHAISSTQATTFTLPQITLFNAEQGTFGAGSTVTYQVGFNAANLSGATTNVGFNGDLSSGTNKWNLYMGGTAKNFLNGNTLIGNATDSGEKLQVTGTSKFTDTIKLKNGTTSSLALTFTLATTTGFYANDDGVGTNLKLQASGQDNQLVLFRNSNIGVGTATPLTKLHIRTGNGSSTLEGLRLANGSNDPNAGNRLSFFFSDGASNIGGAFIDVVKNGSDGNILLSTSATNGTPTEKVRIFGDGNVGINTGSTNSGERLQVTGTARITGATAFGGNTTLTGAGLMNHQIVSTSTAGYSYMIFKNTGASGREMTLGIGGSTTGNDSNKFFIGDTTAGGAIRMIIDTSGNIGFGTYNPDARLRVVSASANSTQAIFGNVDGRGLLIATSQIAGTNDAGTILNARGASSGTFIFQTDGTQRVQIDSTGLIINGGNALEFINSASNAVSAIRPTGGGTSIMSTNSNGLHIAVGTEAAGDLILASNNTERVRLSSNGWFSHASATNPSSSVTDSYVQYSADVTAGNAAPHFRTENGAVIKLYQETTAVGNSIFSQGGGNAVLDDSTFAGYTIRQVVQALRNQGILQ